MLCPGVCVLYVTVTILAGVHSCKRIKVSVSLVGQIGGYSL